ncbi:alpha/beta fold hydrolase [Sporichthya sp.]|uniref:alpha/beta fold hydrolase n=1 Tax=Sporichthya sp. TaxID=65475 RepID=UPI00184B1CD7|nr:alpha/beta fold hydrolase [Sporichthya sp.]MBA3743689.1 alpha/beta fold hydrolase [Sporichthya sp.]
MSGRTGPLPQVARELGRTAARVRNGVRYAAGTQFAPIGPTPSRVIWSEGKAELRHYSGHGVGPEPRLAPPVIVLGGLVGRSYIFDLHEGNSFVARTLGAGFDTFVLDWGIPDADDSANTLETYLARYFPRALQAACQETGADEVSIIGYCMGGTMSLQALAGNPSLPVRNLVLIATPVDFGHLGSMVDAVCEGRLDPATVLDQEGNVPASLIAAFFSVMKPTAPVVKYANLLQNLWDEDYLRGYQALNRCFEQHAPLPGAAFVQIAQQWMRDNAFVTGSLRLGGRAVHLADLKMPVLIVTGDRDELVPEGATAPTAGLLTGTKPEVLALPAGHASLTTGRTAAKHTVPRILGWLADQSVAL